MPWLPTTTRRAPTSTSTTSRPAPARPSRRATSPSCPPPRSIGLLLARRLGLLVVVRKMLLLDLVAPIMFPPRISASVASPRPRASCLPSAPTHGAWGLLPQRPAPKPPPPPLAAGACPASSGPLPPPPLVRLGLHPPPDTEVVIRPPVRPAGPCPNPRGTAAESRGAAATSPAAEATVAVAVAAGAASRASSRAHPSRPRRPRTLTGAAAAAAVGLITIPHRSSSPVRRPGVGPPTDGLSSRLRSRAASPV
mmetsp:Transcript_29007/g.84270  ORF Transcript_29007/g.84270 Transcript_29007/m.84270 type:complete len:252 (-) Transcript_29007:741-1496(-)